MTSLGEYAASLASTATEAIGSVTLVSGNEASDADSIITALLYSYLLHQDAKKNSDCPVAVVKCRREDMQLRSETVLLLQLCGVDATQLVFLDDPCAEGLLRATSKIVLMDHNVADGPLVALGDKVVEIIDHHKDFGKHDHVQGEKRTIAFEGEACTAASACSVLCERYLAHPSGKELLAREGGAAARALLGVILIDSINLNPNAKKVCDRDIAAASALMEIAPSPSQEELYKALDEAKFSQTFWAGLESAQCLRYDFKSFGAGGKTVGLSSVLCPLGVLMAKDGFAEEAQKYMAEYDLYGVLVNTKKDDGSIVREVSLMSNAGSMAADSSQFLTSYESGLLQLQPLKDAGGPPWVLAFSQMNTAASRKQVAPGCIKFLESLA